MGIEAGKLTAEQSLQLRTYPFVPLGNRTRKNGIFQQEHGLRRDTCCYQDLSVPVVENGVAHPGTQRVGIQTQGFFEQSEVAETAAFGEVVDLQDHALRTTRMDDFQQSLGEHDVLAQVIVVNPPDRIIGAERAK